MAAGLAAAVLFAWLLAPAGAGRVAVSTAVAAASTVAVGVGAVRSRSAPWAVMTVGLLLWTAGWVVWFGGPEAFGWAVPFPSVADALFLGAYACTGSALVLLVRAGGPSTRGAVIETAIVGIGIGAVAWVLLMKPQVGSLDTWPTVVALAYPASDVLLATLAAHLLSVSRRNRRAWTLPVLAGLVLQLAADAAYAWETLRGSFGFGDWMMPAWLLSVMCYGAAALSAREAAPQPGRARPRRSTRRVAFLGAASATPLAVAGYALLRGSPEAEEVGIMLALGLAAEVLVMVRLAGLMREVADERSLRAEVEALSARLAEQAATDPLTGLANRTRVRRRVSRALERRSPAGRGTGLLLVDLDDFKVVNDARGHATGDRLLCEVGARLGSLARAGDTVGRLGGDEFVVVLPAIDAAGAAATAQRVTTSLAAPFDIDGTQVRVGASCGVVVLDHGADPADALAQADAAMYAAKAAGGGWRAYDAELHRELTASNRLRQDLAGAAERGELVLHLQPIVELDSGRTVGAEALVRWQHPELGLLPPGRFIELAEHSGAIADIGAWVFRSACEQARAWDAEGRALYVSVNVSPRQLANEAVVQRLIDELATSGADPGRLLVEVTETALMSNTALMVERLEQLRGAGVRAAMDDFGTGYSSLSLLRELPVDVLKIDRSFIDGIDTSPPKGALLAAVHRLATNLGKQPLAEGVETPGQLAHLRTLGVNLAQGYLFSPPLAAAEFAAWLDRPASGTARGLAGSTT